MNAKISEFLTSTKGKIATAAMIVNTGIVASLPITALAAEGDPTPAPIIDSGVMTAVSAGFTSLQSTVTSILVIAVPSIVAIVCTTVGVKFAIKKIKGAMSNAA